MAHHRRKKPKEKKGYTWAYRSEPDSEPDPSKNGPIVKKGKKNWVVSGRRCSFRKHLDKKRSIYGKYHTETSAEKAMESMRKQDESWSRMFPNSQYWTHRKYKVEYVGKDK